MLLDIAKDGKEVSLKVVGNSMAPFLCDNRDYVYFGPLTSVPKVGDIALFQRTNGEYILHRICKRKNQEYYFIGDNQNSVDIEGPISLSQIRAIIEKAHRKGIIIDKKNKWWFFFQHIWIRIIPLRRSLKRFYHNFRYLLKFIQKNF